MSKTPWYRSLSLKVFVVTLAIAASAMVPLTLGALKAASGSGSFLEIVTPDKALLFGAVLSVLVVALGYSLSARLIARVESVARVVDLISDGQFEVPMPASGRDEVGQLAVSVKVMAVKLRQAFERQLDEARGARDLELTRQVAERLLPPSRQILGSFSLSSDFRAPRECAGDWWGCFRLSPARALVVLTDVTGRGPEAALLSASIHTWFLLMCEREAVRMGFTPPADILSELNVHLWHMGRGQAVTRAFLAILDVRSGEMEYAGAGHPSPLLFRFQDEQQVGLMTLGGSGPLLGLSQAAGFRNSHVSLEPMDRVLLYSNGLVECTNLANRRITRRQLRLFLAREFLRGSEALPERLSQAITTFFGVAPLEDDLGAVLLSFEPGGETREE